MKKKILSFIFAICLIVPCTFELTACGNDDGCPHGWEVQKGPTATETGALFCKACQEVFELPKLNETDYVVDDANPDYITYTYETEDGDTFTFNQSNFVFNYEHGILSITGYTGNSSNIVIPRTFIGVWYDEYEIPHYSEMIANIGAGAFSNNESITSIQFLNTASISYEAFRGCSNLSSVIFNSSANIEYMAFYGTALTEIIIPSSGYVSETAFVECNSLATVYHMRTKAECESANFTSTMFNNATQYYYSDTAPTAMDYLNNNCELDTWHYVNDEKVLWTVNLTNNVENKEFEYSHSEVSMSDAYWLGLKEAESQGILADLFDNDQEQIEMVTSSSTKAEYETKFATWYASITGYNSITFANDIVTLTLDVNSTQFNYIEIDNEIYNLANKELVFTFDTANNTIYDELVTDYYTVRHIYSTTE